MDNISRAFLREWAAEAKVKWRKKSWEKRSDHQSGQLLAV